MEANRELLQESFARLEGRISEVKALQFGIKDVQDEIDALRASLKGGRPAAPASDQGGGHQQAGQSQQQAGGETVPPDLSERLGRIEERLEYLTQKWLAVDEELFKLKRSH